MQTTFAILAAAVALVSGQVVTQISDGQIQAPTSASISTIVGASTAVLTNTLQSTIVIPSTYVVPSTSQKAVTSSITIPVTSTTTAAVLTQITDGQIQAPHPTTLTLTSSIISVVTGSVPVVYNNTMVTQRTTTSPIYQTLTQVIPYTSTVTHSAASSSAAVMSSSAIVTSAKNTTTLATTATLKVSTSATVVSYTGAAAPTKAAGALGALVFGAAALILA